MRKARVSAMCFFLLALPAHAQTIVTSPRADSLSVTVYRSDDSQSGERLDLGDLDGYALITETRRVSLPAGRAVLRFEGVADGIIPVSAIVTGLPGGVVQKNRDAQLLSPAALVRGSYGRTLHLKRTNRKTGVVREEDAQIVAGPAGGVILRTKQGLEALGCAGLNEGMRLDGVPEGLTDKPMLSVETQSPRAADAVVQLTYLAEDFDWAASYVLRVSDKPGQFNLFAWLTLANANGQSFPDARTQAVAGEVNREGDEPVIAQSEPRLQLRCWPMDITSTHPVYSWSRLPFYQRPYGGGSQRDFLEGEIDASDIIVTARRRSESLQDVPLAISVAMSAELEKLGDLKLYRIPEPVTVAANAQKQVALITQRDVKGALFYALGEPTDYGLLDTAFDWRPMQRVIRLTNNTESGLGIPLPAGDIAVFDEASGQPVPVEEGDIGDGDGIRLDDTPVGLDATFLAGDASQVMAKLVLEKASGKEPKDPDGSYRMRALGAYRLTLSNASPFPVAVHIPLLVNANFKIGNASRTATKIKGIKTVVMTLGANSQSELTYRLKPAR